MFTSREVACAGGSSQSSLQSDGRTAARERAPMLSTQANALHSDSSPAAILRSCAIEDFFPLINSAAWARIVALTDRLPISTHTVCFEVRLAAGDARVDFAFNMFPGHGVSSFLREVRAAGGWTSVDLGDGRSEERDSGDRGSGVGEFLSTWCTPGATLGWEIPFVCVAFDLLA